MKNFLIYRSSAGSGKTYTLVKEYLKLVLQNPENVRHTLAVTFTNKAADEMKSRIISSLIALSKDEDKGLKELLVSEGVKTDITSAASVVLNKILHNYSYFSVCTFDSFFLKVIRAFAKELKLTIGYNIEVETDVILDKVVDDVFKDIGDDGDLTNYLTNFAFQNIDEDKGWHIDKSIKTLAGEIFKERYWERKLKTSADIIDDKRRIKEFIQELRGFRREFENKLIGTACAALDIITKHGLDLDDFKGKKNKGVGSYFFKMSKKDTYYKGKNMNPYAYCKDILSGENQWYLKDSPKRHLIDSAVEAGLGMHLVDMVRYYEINLKKYISARILLKTIYTVGIFSDIIKKTNEYRDDNRTLLLSDLNRLLRSVIVEDSSPFVYEKIGDYYKNFLVDEFQDTSTFQWQNLLPLVLNSLSEQNFSLIVGDVKQSIYRWRNGNMMLLLRDVEEDLGRFGSSIEIKNLSKNYRSSANVVEFNNRLFSILPQALAINGESGDTAVIMDAYSNVLQKPKENNEGGYVRVEFYSDEKESEQTAVDKAGTRLVEIVNELVAGGISAGDILVLARRKEELRQAASLLTSSGIQVVSDESLLLINSPKVKLILSSLKYLANHNDRFAKAEVLYSYFLVVGGDELNENKVFGYINEAFESLIKTRLDPRELYNRSIYELVEYLVRAFGLDKKADMYLTRFLDVVLEYSARQNQEINAFIQWWEENNDNYSIIASGQSNAVRLMTIHTAKGLESRVVIVPFANWEVNINGARDHIWASSREEPFNKSSAYLVNADSDLKESYFAADYENEYVMTNLDNLNLLYVALTRAQQHLYIISPSLGFQKNIHKTLKGIFESDLWLSSIRTSYNIYEFGTKKLDPDKNTCRGEGEIQTTSIVSCDFRDRTVIKPVHEKLCLSTAENYNTSRNRGILLHKALSYINIPEDIEKAITKVRSQGIMKESFEEELRKELEEIISDNNISPWFEAGADVKAELEIITKDPEKPAIRPDRVIIKDDKIILIDYKTGSEKPEDKKQLKDYSNILKQAGYKNVETYLLYLGNRKIVSVS